MDLEAIITGILGFLTYREPSCCGRNLTLEIEFKFKKRNPHPHPKKEKKVKSSAFTIASTLCGKRAMDSFEETPYFWTLGCCARHRDVFLRFSLRERAHGWAMRSAVSWQPPLFRFTSVLELRYWFSWGGSSQWLNATVVQGPIQFPPDAGPLQRSSELPTGLTETCWTYTVFS